MKKVVCIVPFPGMFTKDKEYSVIKNLPNNSYLIKCNTNEVVKVSRDRFYLKK